MKMKDIQTKLSILINSTPEEVYSLVTIPMKRVELHPVVEGVCGPYVDRSAEMNDVWIDRINNPDRKAPLNAVWKVVKAVPFKYWKAKTLFFGGEETIITVTYYFEKIGDKTQFTRVMNTHSNTNLMPLSDRHASAKLDEHEEFLLRVKDILENKQSL